METYTCNRNCGCQRCRFRSLTGPVVLITVGVLFLVDSFHLHNLDFGDNTWPVLLIVIGVLVLMRRSASIEGHVQPFVGAPTFPMTPAPGPGAPQSSTAIEVRHE